jgi:hypothetical protein
MLGSGAAMIGDPQMPVYITATLCFVLGAIAVAWLLKHWARK